MFLGRQRVLVGAALVILAGGTAAAGPIRPQHTERPGPNTIPPAFEVFPDGETEPVQSTTDAADDTAIWVNPADPSQSTVIGTDKLGALEVYDLSGKRLQTIDPGSRPNNVDIRKGFTLAGQTVDLVTAAGYGMRFYVVDPVTRQLTNVTAPTVKMKLPVAGTCMYHSPVSGKFYVIGNTRDGRVEQWELVDEAGKVGIRSVRGPWNIGTNESEGCVFDDENQLLFHAEEHDGLFRYGAEPDTPTTTPMLIDKPNDRLVPDIEGIALVKTADGGGYLLVSSQGDHAFAVYRRKPPHEFVTKFSVGDGTGADGCSKTDGIEALAANLGPAFPQGVFICQDNENTTPGSEGNQDFKLVPLQRILEKIEAPAGTPPPAAP